MTEDIILCPDCGTEIEPETCRACDGSGTQLVTLYEDGHGGGTQYITMPCQVCEGDGRFWFWNIWSCNVCGSENIKVVKKQD